MTGQLDRQWADVGVRTNADCVCSRETNYQGVNMGGNVDADF
ncbi:MAG: hypothetical protein J07HX5_00301 [halophilic archaeon J07HX5]|nr:MAG: hypothetical protein J07HX5_00301 [halophilic archaeon J07HX5]